MQPGTFLPGSSAEQCKTDPDRTIVPFYMGSYGDSSYVTLLRILENDRAAMLFFNYVGPEMDLIPFLLEIASILATAE